MRGLVPGAAALLLASLLAGCYTYRAVSLTQVTPQQNVRVTVSPARQPELTEILHGSARSFTATYLNAEDGELLFAVRLQNPAAGMPSAAFHNRISVAASDVVHIEARELSKWRTAAVIGALAAGVGTAAAYTFGADRDPGEDKRGETERSVVPLFVWSFSLGR